MSPLVTVLAEALQAWKANSQLEYVSIPIKMFSVVWTVFFQYKN